MFHQQYTLLLLSMGVYSHVFGSEMKRDTTVELATVLNHMNVLESRLQSTMSTLQKNMDDLEATKPELQATKTELQSAKTRLQDQEQHSSFMNSSLIAFKTELASKTKNVAFNVYVTSGGNIAGNVRFGGVHYNAGNGYATSTGKFTAPMSGTYIFSTELEVGDSPRATYIRILHSGTVVSSGYEKLTNDNQDITIPVTAITHLRQGEQVWVYSTDVVHLYVGDTSHFVGALLSPD